MDIHSVPDDMITEYPRSNGEVIDYRMGNVSVSYRGGGRYLCLTCKGVDRFRDHANRGCSHCQRIARFREERQAELNQLKDTELLPGGVVG